MTWKASWQVYGQAKHWSTLSREGRRKTKSNSYRRNKKELCYCKSKQSRLREAVLAVQAKSEVYIIPLTQECAAEWTAAGTEHNKALNWELEKNHLGLSALGKKIVTDKDVSIRNPSFPPTLNTSQPFPFQLVLTVTWLLESVGRKSFSPLSQETCLAEQHLVPLILFSLPHTSS